MEYIFPIKPSVYDPRDHVYEHLPKRRSTIPNTLDLRKYLNYPRNQGKRGTCASFASATIKEYHERLDCNYQGYLSPDSIYFYRPNKPEPGMYLRDVMKILQKNGVAYEEDFPYNADQEPESVPEKALTVMPDFKIKEYAQITSIDGLKEALFKNGVCIIAFPVYDNRPEFWRVKSNTVSTGGHAVAIVGYNSKGFIVRNSWGYSWNGDGTVIYPYTEWGAHWEVWTAVDSESPYQFPNESVWKKILRLPCLN